MKKNLFFLVLAMTVLSFFGCGGAHTPLGPPKVVNQFDLTTKLKFPPKDEVCSGPYRSSGRIIGTSTSNDQYYGKYSFTFSDGTEVEDGHKFVAGERLRYKLDLTAGVELSSNSEDYNWTFDGVPENAFNHDFADKVTNPKGAGKTLMVTIIYTVK